MKTPAKPKAPKAPAPIGGLYDRDPVTGANRFKYIPAALSDVGVTLARVRRELAEGSRKL